MLNRNKSIKEINQQREYDMVIIGGGASGLGVALDAVSRGYKTLLVEKNDFGKGTSSRSTKLVHGGVRYLQQGNVRLVKEALKERSYLLLMASHVSKVQAFIIPFYSRFTGAYYYAGLKSYDLLAGRQRIGKTQWLSKKEVIEQIPNIQPSNLKGGILYYDGQFDDARLCIDVVKTIAENGGTCINYVSAIGFEKNEQGDITGVQLKDELTDKEIIVNAKAVINATGVFTNEVIKMDDHLHRDLVKPSRGSHLVVDPKFLGGETAMMIPKTSDGRVLFLIPWKGKVLVGTTDIESNKALYEPKIQPEEVKFLLNNTEEYLDHPPHQGDVKTTFSGLRPLAAPKDENAKTKEISRGHQIIWTDSGLCNLIGGKWTTFRKMGQDVVDSVISKKGWQSKSSTSSDIKINNDNLIRNEINNIDTDSLKKIIREEMVVTLEDLISRRTRILFLDAEFTLSILEHWAEILKMELGKDEKWKKKQIKDVISLINEVYSPLTHYNQPVTN